MKRFVILALFVVLIILAGFLVYRTQLKNSSGQMWYSGTIDAHESNLAFQTPGRIATILFDEGQSVKAGDVIAELEPSEYDSKVLQAISNVDRSSKAVQQIKAVLGIYEKSLPEDVKQSEAALKIATQTYENTRINDKRYEELYSRSVVTQKERDDVRLATDNSRSRMSQAQSALAASKSNLGKIEATKKDMEQAEAQLELALAQLDEAKIRLGYTKLIAPFDGVILSRSMEPGEVITQTREVLSMADLRKVQLKIFVRETDITKTKQGQRADVKVDSQPGRVYEGRVSYISQTAEFTPKIIQTKEERVKYVYLVKIDIPNPDMSLKPGLPADAVLK
jgi:HlyD family secretion protein